DCQRACMIFWREAWLRKVDADVAGGTLDPGDDERLRARLKTRTDPTRYFCQASELFQITNKLTRPEQLRRCVREVRAGHCGPFEMLRRLGIWVYWRIRRKLLGEYARGQSSVTPADTLVLQAGEWVEVKPLEEIVQTLDPKGHNRGLYFSPDMRLACG